MPVRDQASDAIRAAIMSGELAPGARLVERKLCEELNISRNTLRESFMQLEAEGFIEIRPHRGPIVAEMTDDQARQIYEVRDALECFAIARFIVQARPDEAEELSRVGKQLAEVVSNDTVEAVDEWKTAFYETIFAGIDNEYLANQVRLMYSRLARLRAQSLSHPGRRRQSTSEIRGVLDAIEQRDSDLASARWREHIRNAQAAALDHSASLAEPGLTENAAV
jgi:DNA-binding GntR family transcriptional regulator